MKIRKAVIPAAGYGTRFLPVTKAIPKEMLPVVDKPAIQYVVEEAVNSGMDEIVIVVNRGKQAIENYFTRSEIYDNINDGGLLKSVGEIMNKAKIEFVLQEPMRGNGDAVLVTKDVIGDEPFAVLFGDDVIYNDKTPVIRQMAKAFEETGSSILGVQICPDEIAMRCGCVKPGRIDGKLIEAKDLIEKPTKEEMPSNIVSLGRFILTPDIFEELENAPLYKNEIYLTVALRNLMKKKPVYAYEFEGHRYDLGNKLGFCQANVEYFLRSGEHGDAMREYILNLAEKLK